MKIIIKKKTEQKQNFFDQNMPKNHAAIEMKNLQEITEKRGWRHKVYSRNHKKMVTEYYDSPVHYRDANNQFKNIDVRFTDNGVAYETKANTFHATFSKNPKDGKVFEMEQNLCRVGLISQDVAENAGCHTENCIGEEIEQGKNCKAVLRDIRENVDLEYIVDAEKIKENIIVKEKSDRYEYVFLLSLDNLAINLSRDGNCLELLKKDSGRVQFYIPAPVMYDAAGERSDAVYYEITQEKDDLLWLKVVADKEWINAADRAFPVVIDPQIKTAQYTGPYSYYEEDYEDSIFRYTTVKNRMQTSDGEGETIGNELRIYRKELSEGGEIAIDSKLTILKNKLPAYLLNPDNIVSVVLKLEATSDSQISCIVIGSNYYLGQNTREFTADITDEFLSSEDEVPIWLQNYYYRVFYGNDIHFYPPVLQIEYKNRVEELFVEIPPDKTVYYPGEKFDCTGMVVRARYENGTEARISDYTYTPEGALATYDEGITISYDGVDLLYRDIQIYPEGFNDRRPNEGFENVYIMREVNPIDGTNIDNTAKYIRIEIFDGVEDNDLRAGTPLTAEKLNKMVVRTENLRGIIKEENLPERLRQKDE